MHATDETRTRNRAMFDGAFGRAYSYMMERPWMGRAIGMALWGGDSQPFYGANVSRFMPQPVSVTLKQTKRPVRASGCCWT